MTTILVTSPDPNAGKTTVAIALGQRLSRLGKPIAYRRLPGPGAAGDAAFARAALALNEPSDVIGPSAERIGEALATDADVLLIEAGDSETAAMIAKMANVVPLIVARFRVDDLAERIIAHAHSIGAAQARVLLNVVPEKGLRQVRQRVIPALQQAGLRVVGVLPQDRVLLGTTVGELADYLQARILCAHDHVELPVEAIMIAAMSDEGAEEYFRRLSRKAVVAAGDRPDIHLPALATDTSCIVLSQGLDPDPTVLETADELGVPLLAVQPDTIVVLDLIADHFAEVRFRQRHKIGPAVALLRAHLDEDALFAALGVKGQEVA